VPLPKPADVPATKSGSDEPEIPEFAHPLIAGQPKVVSKSPTPLSKILGSRDWNVPFACDGKGVTLLLTEQQFSLAMLQTSYAGEHPLRKTVRDLIERKQALVRPGEPPFRPILHFEVPPEGLQAFLLSYAVLENLQLPVIRHNVKPNQPTLEDYFRK
jgi:hypothetical protein